MLSLAASFINEVEEDSSEHLRKLINDEYFDWKLYELILKDTRDRRKREVVEKLYEKEKRDYTLLQSLLPDYKPRLNVLKLWLYFIIYKLFGITFVIKFAESNEQEIIRGYQRILAAEKNREVRSKLKRLLRSTKRYEYLLRDWIREDRLKYLGFVALGVTDAIVSLVGTQAGFLGATGSGFLVGISTIIVGLATTISMVAATYMQAKELKNGLSPLRAAASSGITYVIVTLLLAVPYFVILNALLAFGVSLFIALITLVFFTYYVSVIDDRNFKVQLRENLTVVALATILGYALGVGADYFFNISFNSL